MSIDGKITFKVATSAGYYEGTFEETTKVAEVIDAIVTAMKLVKGDAFELAFDGESLDPERELGSFNLPDGAELDLIATGSAV